MVTTAACAPPMPEFRDRACRLVRRHIAPHLADWERRAELPRSLFAAIGSAGVFRALAPRSTGGGGLPYGITFIRELMSLPAAGVCTSLCVQIHTVVPLLAEHGSLAQRERWLGPLLDGTAIASVAVTEPTGGSDLVRSVHTTADRTDEGWVLTGEKTFITNAPIADVLLVLARTAPAGARATGLGFSLFVVPADLPGVSVRQMDTAGLRSSPTGLIQLSGCRLPAEALLGRPGLALAHLSAVLPKERLAIAAGALACARWALRRTGPATHQDAALRAELGRWAIEVAATDAFVDAAADAWPGPDSRLDADLAKALAADLTERVVDGCVRLSGPTALRGGGGDSLLPVLRDVQAFAVFGGSSETVLDTAATELLRVAAATAPPPDKGKTWFFDPR